MAIVNAAFRTEVAPTTSRRPGDFTRRCEFIVGGDQLGFVSINVARRPNFGGVFCRR